MAEWAHRSVQLAFRCLQFFTLNWAKWTVNRDIWLLPRFWEKWRPINHFKIFSFRMKSLWKDKKWRLYYNLRLNMGRKHKNVPNSNWIPFYKNKPDSNSKITQRESNRWNKARFSWDESHRWWICAWALLRLETMKKVPHPSALKVNAARAVKTISASLHHRTLKNLLLKTWKCWR